MNKAEASGRGYLLSEFASYELVELPLPHGQTGPFGRTTEEVQIRNLPNHVATRVERAVERDGGLRYRNEKEAPEIFGHLVGSLQGLELVDKKTSKDLDSLLAQFSNVKKSERKQFVRENLRPYLNGLRTGKRQ
jgi:hypothetical protein